MTAPAAPALTGEVRTLDLNKPITDVASLRRMIGEKFKTLQAMLPNQMKEDRFAALVVGSASKQPDILKCTGVSILNVMYQAASLGLEINAATGEAYIIPFRDRDAGTVVATLVPGYKGLVKLAIQSREVNSIEARLVYKGEEKTFKVFYGTDSHIEHIPNFEVDRTPDNVLFGYAVAKLPREGTSTFEVMTRKQLDAIWSRSKSANSGPWKTDREEMYRKTVTRRLCKYLPMSPQLAEAIELSDNADNDYSRGGDESYTRGARSEGASTLNDALQAKAAPTPAAAAAPAQLTEGAMQPTPVASKGQAEETAPEREARLAEDMRLSQM